MESLVAAPTPSRARAAGPAVAAADLRHRWRMGSEARLMVAISAMLLAFGLAVLYSASAIESVNRGSTAPTT